MGIRAARISSVWMLFLPAKQSKQARMNRSEWICLVKASPKFAMWKISSRKCIKSAIKFKNRKKNNRTLLILPLRGYSKLALQYYLPMLSLVISVFYTSTSKYIHRSILLIINYIPSETHSGFDPAENNLITTVESKVHMDHSSSFTFHSYSLSVFSSTTQNLFLPPTQKSAILEWK